MRRAYEPLVNRASWDRHRLVSRRGVCAAGVIGALAGTFATPAFGSPALAWMLVQAQDQDFKDDVDVLNFALKLEHMQHAFYRDGLGVDPPFTFGNDLSFETSIDSNLAAISDHEAEHVERLTALITGLEGVPIAEERYDFGYGGDAATFLERARELERIGVAAYNEAVKFLKDEDVLKEMVGIVAVEARHASYLQIIKGNSDDPPFPKSYEDITTKTETLEKIGPYIIV